MQDKITSGYNFWYKRPLHSILYYGTHIEKDQFRRPLVRDFSHFSEQDFVNDVLQVDWTGVSFDN